MGCSFETAKQRNQCSISSSRSSRSRNSSARNCSGSGSRSSSSNKIRQTIAISPDNQTETAAHKKERRQSYHCSEKDSRSRSRSRAEGVQRRHASASFGLVQSHVGTSVFNTFTHNNKLSCSCCGSHCCNHNCHYPLTTATATATATSGHKSNTNDSCPIPLPQVDTSNSRSTAPLVTAANISTTTTTTTTTLPKKPQTTKTTTATTTTTKTTSARSLTLPAAFEDAEESKADATAEQLQYKKIERRVRSGSESASGSASSKKACLHSYRNATSEKRGMAAKMAAACGISSCTVHEMLSYARDVLTARLSSVSNKLIDHISYYAEAAAVATTVRCGNATQKRQMKKRKKKKHQRHCTWHCCQRNTSLKSPTQSPTPSSSSSSSSSSSAVACSDCNISSPTPCAAASVTASAETSTTSSSPSSPPSSSAAAAYNYIGHNYYHLLRNTISFYAASSVILVLCYLTTTTSAAAANSEAAPLETHPIGNFDWSKFDESSSDKEILDMLLEKKRYDKRLLPPVNGTLTVNVNVLLLSLASPDESSLKYEVEFLLNQQWSDPRLQYGNKSHYDFLNALHHHDSIWTPDTYFIMHGDFKDPIIPMHFALRIYRNGTITYAMRRHLILSCQGSLHIFPFDDPKCSFSMESISYEVAQIKYVWKNDEDTLRKSPSLTSLNAYLIKNQTTACEQTSWRGNYSCLRVDLIFTRDRAFYFTTVFIPGIILVTSSFITFWLEWNAVPARSMIGNYSCLQVALTFTRDRAYYFTTVFIPGIILVTSSFITFWLEWNAVPARVMIGVTTMLNFFTTSNGFRGTLPVVSNLTAMNVWDGVCMCFIYASLLEFVCVNYVGRKRPLHNVVYRPGENPVTQRLPAVLSRIGVILASPLEIIEREFQTALSSEKAAAGLSSAGATMPQTPTSSSSHIQWERHYGGGMIGAAVKNLRARSIRRRCDKHHESHESHESHSRSYSHGRDSPIRRRRRPETESETEPEIEMEMERERIYAESRKPLTTTTVTVEEDLSNGMDTFDAERNVKLHIYSEPVTETVTETETDTAVSYRKRSHSMATNTPPLIIQGSSVSGGSTHVDIHVDPSASRHSIQAGMMDGRRKRRPSSLDIESIEHGAYPVRPPRKKTSRSTSPMGISYDLTLDASDADAAHGVAAGASSAAAADAAATEHVRFAANSDHGEKRRDAGAPNEIVACTTCGGSSSPCTHSANNGCATETCFVQVRKKEPPHPIRVAKTIDVIARITFPTAYAIFLIFFFVHYKGFS